MKGIFTPPQKQNAPCDSSAGEGLPSLSRRHLIAATFGATAMIACGGAIAQTENRQKTARNGRGGGKRALIIVDMQNDFLPGGALAVERGDEIIPVINALYEKFDTIIVTQDWHPHGHISFASAHDGKEPNDTIDTPNGPQILWPDHCVQGTWGAKICKDLRITKAQLIIRKGYNIDLDSYSAFKEADGQTPTGLAGYLRERGIAHLFVTGVATDFCVGWTAIDAASLGFDVSVVEDATRGINLDGSLDKAWEAMKKAGVSRIKASDIG
ncbi:bifunctional nicotinamidase/pyrazinamidase [Enterobacter sp. CC120223-11]|uniref:bifunctional nicotinamidase/pyrazinamidase n=1 Tax=Enterobacter sp. CC120223-11 TaxID=1378073 RepID=UPI000BC4BF1A|nr:bifunctional nicotinamidase/pyrazinamidase [Enterobacter sp. CC120223-11]SNY66406.1 nicotinamidase/pyrazinamidase [Enterobacter sp. CC120223-11]